MDNEIQKFKSDLKQVYLSHTEKESMKKQFDEMMRGSRHTWMHFFRTHYLMSYATATVIALLFVGSVSYKAEGSLPGELLYPIKRNINESLIQAFSVSTERKNLLSIDLAERRLKEMTTLLIKDELTPEHIAQIKKDLVEYNETISTVALDALSKGDATEAVEIIAQFNTTIGAFEKIFDTILSTKPTESDSQRAQLQQDIDSVTSDLSSHSTETDSFEQELSEMDTETIKHDSEHNLLEAQEALEDVSEWTGEDGFESLSPIQSLIEKGTHAFLKEDYDTAFILLEQAEQMSQELSLIKEVDEEIINEQ